MTSGEDKSEKRPSEDKHFPTISSADSAEGLGGQIGPYKLLSVLGEGGFGVVYLAERQRPVRRRVALKVIKPGMDSKQVIARFETEREALALLEHPNIASVFDAGTTEAARPYFAMEYVEGLPLTEHCDREKLSIDERLELFLHVCEAVEHAHQKGIIHRDIKPSNILVSILGDKAVPKIIDFGVAKAISQPLTERTLFTEQGQLLGTPEYMSPEQAEMAAPGIDTRTDIYSLGVLLYELLTGVLPFDRKTLQEAGFAEIQRIIREEDPPRPSTRLSSLGEEAKEVAESRRTEIRTLAKRLHKELEWIPLKAMRKERKHRYRSGSELADDIKNYLNGAPLIAGPPSTLYRFKKFVRRNRVPVAVATAMAASLFVGLIVSTKMYFRAESLRLKAEEIGIKEKAARVEAEREKERAQKALDQVARQAYLSSIQTATKNLRANNHTHVSAILEETDPSLRGWEWDYLMSMCQLPDWTLEAHDGEIRALLTSSDGKFILTGGKDKRLVLWNSNDLKPIWEKSFSESVCWGNPAVFHVKEHFVAVLIGERMCVFSAKDGKTIYRSEPFDFRCLCQHPDGTKLYAGTSSGQLIVFDTFTWQIQQDLHMGKDIQQLAIGSEGKLLSVECRDVNGWPIYVYDTETLGLLYQDGTVTGEEARDLAILKKKGVLLVPVGYHVRIRSVDSRSPIGRLTGHTRHIYSIDYAVDESRIITGSWDGTANIYDTNDWKLVGTVHHDAAIFKVAFLPDGGVLTAGVNGTVKKWSRFDLVKWEPKIPINIPNSLGAYGLEYRPDGKMLIIHAWGHDRIILCNAKNGEIDYLSVEGGRHTPTLFRPGTNELIVGASDELRFYDTATEGYPVVRRIPIHRTLHNAVFDARGQFLAVTYSGGDVGLIDVETGRPRTVNFETASQGSHRLALSNDGAMLAALEERGEQRLLVWDTHTGELRWSAKAGQGSFNKGLAFHPAGHIIATGDDSGIIELWDVDLKQRIKILRGHMTGVVGSLQFSPDGRRLLSGGHDNRLVVWDWKLGKPLITFIQGAYVLAARFSPDGQSIANTDGRPVNGWIRHAIPWRTQNGHWNNERVSKQLPFLINLDLDKKSETDPVWECIEAGELKNASQLVKGLQSTANLKSFEAGQNIQIVVKALADAYYRRAKKNERAGRYTEAIADYEASVHTNSEHARALSDLSWLLAICPSADFRDIERAAEEATKACKLTDWNNHEFVSKFAAACSETGDFAAAVKWQRKAIELLTEAELSQWQDGYESLLKLYEVGKPYNQGSLPSLSIGPLVALWKFVFRQGDNVVDSSGNRLDGRLVGSACVVADPERGAVLSLDGKNAYVNFGNDPAFNITDEITVAFWMKAERQQSYQATMLSKGDRTWRMAMFHKENYLEFGRNYGSSTRYITGQTDVKDGQWHHVAGVYDGSVMYLYVDGRLDASNTHMRKTSITDAPVWIGGNCDYGLDRCFHGLLDDIRVYRYALSEAEVSAIHAGERAGR